MSVTQQVSLNKSCVICTIYSLRPKRAVGLCKVLSRFSWKIAFTLENYAQQPTQVIVPWEHLSFRVRSSFPEQGVTCHIFLHSAEVCPFKRDQSLAAQLSSLLVHTSLVWGPVIDPSQSLPSPHNACPPNSRKQVVSLIFTPNDEVPRRPLRTSIDTSGRGH
jgi:hypothetical protein